MAGLCETPNGERTHIAFFGLRNAGKSTLVNAFTGQNVAIVSDVPGTTTDPVSKAMEILPLGPCLITDTAGLDDEGKLGRQRVERSLKVLATTDIAIWVSEGGASDTPAAQAFRERCRALGVTVLEYRRGDSVEDLKNRVANVRKGEETPGLLEGLVGRGGRVLCVCPIDAAAPKGRLILPQVQLIRDCLDRGIVATVCQPADVAEVHRRSGGFDLVVTDSQAFGAVAGALPPDQPLTGFSVLLARQKGDLAAYAEGLERLDALKDGDRVLVAEGCTHRRQCNDIGTVKIPKALQRLTGKRLEFVFSSGSDFPEGPFALIVQCGGCMLTRREVLRRIARARAAHTPIVNYGMLLAVAAGVLLRRALLITAARTR